MKYKIVTNNKMKYFGTQQGNKIVINRKLSKTKNEDGTPKHNKYPGLADSIKHELVHAQNPKMSERKVHKKTKQAIKHMSKKSKQKLYNMLPKSGTMNTKRITAHKAKHKKIIGTGQSPKKPVTSKDKTLARKHLEDSVKFNQKHAQDHIKAIKKGDSKASIAYNKDHAKHHEAAAEEAISKLKSRYAK